MNRSEAVDILLATRDRVADGWCQGNFEDNDGNVCLVRAMDYAVNATHGQDAMMLGFKYPIISLLQVQVGGQVMHWNDTPGRTKDQVIDLLNDTALAVKAGEIGDFNDA